MKASLNRRVVRAVCLLAFVALFLGAAAAARADMSGWAHRIEFSIDRTRVDGDLADFPVRLHLGASSGIAGADLTPVFDTLGPESRKIAVTSSDGLTQLYVEIEAWDATSRTADLWVRVPLVSSTQDTVLFLYYDPAQPDNTAYVGLPGEPAAQAVWNPGYVGVWHMGGDPALVRDSTAYGHDGAARSGSGMGPDAEVPGVSGSALSFDGVNDGIYVGSPEALRLTGDETIEAFFRTGSALKDQVFAGWCGSGESLGTNVLGWLGGRTDGSLWWLHENGAGTRNIELWSPAGRLKTDRWHHAAAARDDTAATVSFMLDGDVAATGSYSWPAEGGGVGGLRDRL